MQRLLFIKKRDHFLNLSSSSSDRYTCEVSDRNRWNSTFPSIRRMMNSKKINPSDQVSSVGDGGRSRAAYLRDGLASEKCAIHLHAHAALLTSCVRRAGYGARHSLDAHYNIERTFCPRDNSCHGRRRKTLLDVFVAGREFDSFYMLEGIYVRLTTRLGITD